MEQEKTFLQSKPDLHESSDEMDPPTPYSRLWELVATESREIKLVVIYGIAIGMFALVVPIAAQSLVNTVAFNSLLQPIVVLTILVLCMLGVASTLRVIQTSIVEGLQQRLFARISLDLAYRLTRVRIESFDNSRGTELINRFFEIMTVQKAASLLLLDGLAVILQSAIGMILLAFYHPLLLAFDLILIICIGGVLWIPAKRAVKTSIYESKAKYRVANWLEEIARNPIVFRLSGGAPHAIGRANAETEGYLRARKAHFRILIGQISGTLLVQTVVSALLLGLGSILVMKGQLTLGQLIAAELIVTMVVSSFAKFGKYLEGSYDLLAALDKLGNLFDLPLERQDGETVEFPQSPFAVTLKDVSFTYSGMRDAAMRDVSFNLLPGQKLGINGINGSGKSTLFDLLVGLRLPTQGAVEIGGLDLREVNLEAIRSHIALIRKVEIFDGTVLDNVRVGRSAMSIETVREALRQSGLLDEISALPEGVMTVIAGSQSPLSAGQLQRLMLARAFAAKPKLLLLDEALENIDAESKETILKTLFDPKAPWTLIIATHDLFELSQCTRVMRLQDGRLYDDVQASSGGKNAL